MWGLVYGVLTAGALVAILTPTLGQRVERRAEAAVCAFLAEQLARGEIELIDYVGTDCPLRPAAEALGLGAE